VQLVPRPGDLRGCDHCFGDLVGQPAHGLDSLPGLGGVGCMEACIAGTAA
jgi:hypothetical protein